MLKKISTKSFSIIVALAISSGALAYDEQDFVVAKPQEPVTQSKDAVVQDGVFDKISTVAKNLIGTKYKFGGITPATGFDCSGFVKYVFNEGAGIKLPRGSRDMRSIGKSVDLKSLKPGDLIFFRLNTSHVGIYIGENRFVHAPRTGRSVTIDSLLDSSFGDKISGARRLVELD